MDDSLIIGMVLLATKGLLIFVAVVFLISGLDDLLIDLAYAVRSLWRRWFVMPHHQPLTEARLREHPEQPIAVLVPAWDESAVIRPMLINLLGRLEYQHLHLFVGTYPNDPATIREVELVRERHPNVHRISTPHDGPTCKADCLNWVYQGIRLFEREQGLRFAIFVMQDCEDVIHPLAYKLLNLLIPRKDMVQLPVLSLPRPWWAFTAGHYIDEFAQLHYKDLVVREVVDHRVPAAGVGCAFSRRAFETLAADRHNLLFNTDSLTEDYDLGLRLKDLGMSQIFVKFFVTREMLERHWLTGRERVRRVRELVAVREYFPDKLGAAVRQKSRWVMGIALQGWAHLGWMHGWSTRYMLWRDRKALVTNLVNVLGYVVVGVVVVNWLAGALFADAWRYPALVEPGTWLYDLLIANAALLALRVLQRAYCVWRLYDARQALLSVPRAVWGNLINFLATVRAIRRYVHSLRTGEKITWDKTQHQFPSEEALRGTRRKLGELLLERRWVTVEQLKQALSQQREAHRPLGAILTSSGWLGEEQLNMALQEQA
jgi:adsorption protein B